MNARPSILPELLAPAGSPESFRAAVAAGADAVYLSGKRFGARKYAANFTDSEIEEALKYAHSHGIRVYVTVNTLIHDRELAGALEYLLWLWSIGVDAVLIQDTGLASLAQEFLPDLCLYASTQLTIHNADGVRWAHEQGFSRVVLARELSLDEVTRIAEETRDTGTGLEVFAHGALCYGYSGQCLLSSVIGGRSGNRGMCAQPCRKPYTLVAGEADEYGRPVRLADVPLKDPYLLSPKDLCTYRHLNELVRSPVVSLKIEGRMKSPEYVTIVVSTYRKALDAIAAGNWKPTPEAFRDLLLAFNRGFTDGYLFGDRYGKLMGRDAPGNRGLLIGRVEQTDRRTATAWVKPVIPVIPVPGDGLLITLPGKPEQDLGFALNSVPGKARGGYALPITAPVPKGAMVCITSSRDLEARVRQLIAKPPSGLLRPLPVDLSVNVDPDGSFRIDGSISRPDGVQVAVSLAPEQRMEPAKTRPLTRDQLVEQFQKTGGTPFAVRHCTVRYGGNLFIPVGVLNELRREFFRVAEENLDAASRPTREEVDLARLRLQAGLHPSTDNHPAGKILQNREPRISLYTDSPEGVEAAAASGADTVCFEPRLNSDRHVCEKTDEGTLLRTQMIAALDSCKKTETQLVWKIPRIMHDTEIDGLISELRFLYDYGLGTCMSENPGISQAIHRAVPGMALQGGSGLSIFNHAAASANRPLYSLLTLSPELSEEEIASLVTLAGGAGGDLPEFSLIVQGAGEALVTEDCIPRLFLRCHQRGNDSRNDRVFLGLRDETGRIFPIRSEGLCRTSIANSSEICLIDMLPAVLKAGIRTIAIDARNRPPLYIRKMISLYREALAVMHTTSGQSRDEGLRRLKEQVKEIAPGGITTGHFLRGLKE